jgi:hypothetical protein
MKVSPLHCKPQPSRIAKDVDVGEVDADVGVVCTRLTGGGQLNPD